MADSSLLIPCRPWLGRPSEYQGQARWVIEDRLDRNLPWYHVAPLCNTSMCLTDEHLGAHRAQRIAYPAYVCTYCGMPGYTKDHLLPTTVTGKAVRKFVAVVPACGECNSGIGDRVGYRIGDRREEAHQHLRKKYRKVLAASSWTVDQLDEFGPNLRQHIEQGNKKREVVLYRLDWPVDPNYDLRAFQKSGIEDPYDMDLI